MVIKKIFDTLNKYPQIPSETIVESGNGYNVFGDGHVETTDPSKGFSMKEVPLKCLNKDQINYLETQTKYKDPVIGLSVDQSIYIMNEGDEKLMEEPEIQKKLDELSGENGFNTQDFYQNIHDDCGFFKNSPSLYKKDKNLSER